jgi:4-hydroxythreonine-4-phosphate dehydrogenase
MPVQPVIAITVGDPAGVGPEIVARSLRRAIDAGRPIVFGHWPTLKTALARIDDVPDISLVDEPIAPPAGGLTVVPAGPDCPPISDPGPEAAAAQIAGLIRAVDAANRGICQILVTAPMNKALAATVEPGFTGHTEFLAKRSGIDPAEVTMVFASHDLAVGLIATHLPLADVPSTIVPARYRRAARHLIEVLEAIAPGRPLRIAVAALNPHGGEDGRFGDEEARVIDPICRELGSELKAEISGPIPADIVFRDALAGRYDGVVAAYHDQAMIPLKLAGLGSSANVTVGLPFVRTSPDHGVAYDAARSGDVDASGMMLALDIGARLWSARAAEV